MIQNIVQNNKILTQIIFKTQEQTVQNSLKFSKNSTTL